MQEVTDTISTLNDLIETCKDGEYGFMACAQQTKSPELRTLLENRATECRNSASQLQAHVRDLGGSPDTDGSVMGTIHRGWVSVRTKLSRFDDLALLKECARGEDAAVESYRDALDQDLPPRLRNLVTQQFEGARRNQDMIRRLLGPAASST